MAIIQDLPPELLSRILELTVEQRDHVAPYRWTSKWKCGLSLVARDWADPGQIALLSHVSLLDEDHQMEFIKCATHRKRRTTDTLIIGRLYGASNETMIKLLQQGNLSVAQLDLQEDLWADVLKRANVQHLNFGLARPHSDIILRGLKELPLRCISLWVGHMSILPEQLLVISRHTLRTLSITWAPWLSKVEEIALQLQPVASVVQHLILRSTAEEQQDVDNDALFVRSLPPFIHLTALTIVTKTSQLVLELAKLVPSRLVVLNVENQNDADESDDEDEALPWDYDMFLEALKQPSLSKLKKWTYRSSDGAGSSPIGALWLAKCEERGIQVVEFVDTV